MNPSRNAILATLLVLASSAPAAHAALLPAYDLVGEDPKGDMVLPLATGANFPACGTGLSCDKYDILSLEAANELGTLQLKLNTGASYLGTTSIIYAVHFKVAGKAYFACWNMQSAGTTTMSNDVQEDTLACSRFTEETQVGPSTRAAGVQSDTDPQKRTFVRWEVPKAAIGNAPAIATATDVVAEIWARSPSSCCPGSQTPSQYMWNLADRAPDKDGWAYPGAGGANATSLSLLLTSDATTAEASPGATATYNLTAALAGDGSATVSYSAEGLPEGYAATFDPSSSELDATTNSSQVTLSVEVPDDAAEGDVAFTVQASSDANASATLDLVLHVTPAEKEPPASKAPSKAPPTSSSAANTTANESGAAKSADPKGIPGPGLIGVASAIAVAAALGLSRRRRA